jgi:uncharacterized membrane protein
MNSQGTNQPVIIPHIPGGLGIIYLIIGFLFALLSKSLAVFFVFSLIYLIFILVSFDQYSLILNNPSIFRYGLRYGIYILFALFVSVLPTFVAKFVNMNNDFLRVEILTVLLMYVIYVFAVFNLKKALTELSIALNHKLFDISGKLIFWGPILFIILIFWGANLSKISIILIGYIAEFIGYILLMVAFFTAPRIGIINNQFSKNPSANALYQMLKLLHWTGYVICWSIGRLTKKYLKT